MSSNEQNKIVGSKREAHEIAAQEYWTPERLAAAKPVPPPKPGPGEQKAEALVGVVPGYTASGQRRAEGVAGTSDAAAGGQPVANPNVFPYSTCGKLFFTQGGQNFSGSAA